MINLHNHSRYSHDSLSKISEIVKFAKNNRQSSIALSDHGNINGSIEFYNECKKQGIKPILGCELYVCQPEFLANNKTNENKRLNHLVVLAKNMTGWKNLLKITKIANENFYYRPRIDESILFAHSEGLIVLNGHMSTSVFDNIFMNLDGVKTCKNIDCARDYLFPDYEERILNIVNRYKEVFGDDFYIEVQLFDPDDIIQQASGFILFEFAQKYGINVVGTGDSHYVYAKEAKFHRAFCALKQNTKIKDLPNIGYFFSGRYGLITNEWAEQCYPKELIEQTVNIANKIEEFDITYKSEIPEFPGVSDAQKTLSDYCYSKIKELGLSEEYVKRLDYELGTIKDGKFASYFLIVADYINWAESQGMLVGPARGSSCGSLVAMATNIIKVDPIKYDLLYSRFISEDRIKAGDIPDIDTDFPASRREEVINYIKEKYGHDKVAGVVTFGSLQAKNALKDVLRIHSACSFSQMNKVTELIPSRDKISDKMADFAEETGSNSVLYYCLVKEPDLLKDYCRLENGNLVGDYAQYFELAIGLEGAAIRSESKHPSAVIISKYPLVDIMPLIKDKSSDDLIAGLDMNSFPFVGANKFDILGLKNLDCLVEVNKLLREIGIDER